MKTNLIVFSLVVSILSTGALGQGAPLPLPPSTETNTVAPSAGPSALPPLPGPSSPAVNISPQPVQPMLAAPAPIDALPQIAKPSDDQTPLLNGLYMPGIAAALMANKPETLPDLRSIRRYIFSIYAGLANVCGPHGDAASLNAMGYVEPGLGPGRNVAKFGLEKMGEMLLSYGQFAKSGNIQDFANSVSNNAYEITEGRTDGATIASRLGCRTPDYNALAGAIERLMREKSGKDALPDDSVVFASLMSPAYRTQLNIEDPAITLKKRQILAASGLARKQCVSNYDSTSFCGCLFGRIQPGDLTEGEWKAFGAQFSTIVGLAKQNPPIAQSIRSCTRGL